MVFKKHLRPLTAKGTVTKHRGKGATEQRTVPGMRESLTGGDGMGRAMNAYPKPAPPQPSPGPLAPPVGAAPPPGAAGPMGPMMGPPGAGLPED